MIYQNVDLHGIAELHEIEGHDGLRMQRVPEATRAKLDEPAQSKVLAPGGAEIRFVIASGEKVSVTLSSSEGAGNATLFFGPFHAKEQFNIGKTPKTIEVAYPPQTLALSDDRAASQGFSPRVCRLVLRGGNQHIHSIEGDARLPEAGETPSLRMLSYGTSITHGAAATQFHLSYVAQTAWRLGADLTNLGVGGAALCEPAFADHIAERDDWDFATLCLSVNMIGHGFSVPDFADRVRYFVGQVAGSNLERPVGCITILPYFRDWGAPAPNGKVHGEPDDYRHALEEIVAGLGLPNLRAFAGPELMPDIGGLTVDMIHPSDFGMIQIGENLAARMRPLIEGLK